MPPGLQAREDQCSCPRSTPGLSALNGALRQPGKSPWRRRDHLANSVILPKVVVPVDLLATLKRDAELDGPARRWHFRQGHLKGEDVCVTVAIHIVHVLARDVAETPPGVKGDADRDSLLVAKVADLDGPREGPLLDETVLQGDKPTLQAAAESQVVSGWLGEVEDVSLCLGTGDAQLVPEAG